MKILIIFRPLCWINTLWQTIIHPDINSMLGTNHWVWFDGHEWVEMPNQKVPVGQGKLQCERCGLIDPI